MFWEVGRVKTALKNIVGKEMGEVGMGSEEGGNGGMELMPSKETHAAAEEETSCSKRRKKKKKMLPAINNNHDDDDDSASAVVRWESFLPKMVLRVLLVEADDSTRQIIAALLRKCSYRVAAVADGLKAWEVLKGRPHNIDLILTEIDLPAISGFALLTLIMEHEICKNIPVIMMSSQDSVSTVYKCMLRGAADFLVKPVRKNELRNLWQHVWRRQASSSGGVEPQDESVAQQKVEATAQNYAINNYSSDYMVSIQKNRESFDKGSDAQRSCTNPGLLDAEGAEMECMQGLSYSKWSKPPQSSNFDKQKQESCQLVKKKVQAMDHEAQGLQDASWRDSQVMNSGEDINSGVHWECGLATEHGPDNNHLRVDSAREAIDLIGTFDNYLKCSPRDSGFGGGAFKVDSLPQLDLSLRRSLPSGSVNQVTDERHRLNHSDASAFLRYVNRTARPQCSTSPSICNHQKVEKSNSDRQLSNDTVINNLEKHIDLPVAQPGESETRISCPQQRLLPAPVAIRGVRLENISNGYGFLVPQPFRTQPQMLQSSGSVNHQEASLQVNAFYRLNHQTGNPQKYSGLMIHECNNMADQNENMEGHKLEVGEDRGRISSATDQSANSSFCNGSESYFHSQRSASNDKVDTVPFMSTEGCGHEETFRAHDGNSIKSVQREAALTKFRLKRKERCFEKKVRYESRKKLAEKRQRVKGQFVRQAIDDSPPGNSSAG